MSEKKNAIILTGLMRDYENTVEKFKKNLANDSTDLFISTWDKRGIKKFRSRIRTLTDGTKREVGIKENLDDSLIDEQDVKNIYSPYLKDMRVFNQELFEESIEQYAKIVEAAGIICPSVLGVHVKKKPKTAWTLMRRYCIFYMTWQGWKLMEEYENKNGFKYDKVCKIRADFEKGGYYPKVNWSEPIPPKRINIGKWNLQQYPSWDKRISFTFQDHFAVGNRDDMLFYFNMFNNLYKLMNKFDYKPKEWHAEYCLSLWLTMNGITCKSIK